MPRSRRRATKRRRTAPQASSAASASAPAAERLFDPNHAEALRRGLERLWRDGTQCDLTIKTPATATAPACAVKVHSVVVAAVSAPLEKMVAGEMASGGSDAPLGTRPLSLVMLIGAAVLLLRKNNVSAPDTSS